MSKFIPNSFQVPNVLIDEYLSKISANAFKVYIVMVRKTKGWQKDYDSLSQSQIMAMAGIGSHHTTRKAIDELIGLGLISEYAYQGRQSTFFVSLEGDPEKFDTSAETAELGQNDLGRNCRTTSAETAEPLAESAEVPRQKLPTQKTIKTNKEIQLNTLGENSPQTKTRKKNSVTFPDDFKAKEDHEKLARSLSVNLSLEFHQFKDYHLAKGSKFADWDAALRNWIRNAAKYSKSKIPQPRPGVYRDNPDRDYHRGVSPDGRF